MRRAAIPRLLRLQASKNRVLKSEAQSLESWQREGLGEEKGVTGEREKEGKHTYFTK